MHTLKWEKPEKEELLPPSHKTVTDAPRCGHCSPMASSYAKMTSMPSLASCSVLFPIHLNPVNVSSWWIPSARATAPNIFEDTVLFSRAYLEAGGDEGERWVVRVQARLMLQKRVYLQVDLQTQLVTRKQEEEHKFHCLAARNALLWVCQIQAPTHTCTVFTSSSNTHEQTLCLQP